MNETDRKILYKLIRDHEDLLGASRTAMLAINAFIVSIRELKCPVEQIQELYLELSEAIKTTEPQIVPLIHLVESFEKEIRGHMKSGDLEEIRRQAERILKEKLEMFKTRVGKVIEHGLSYIQEGDVIIVHTASSDVINMLTLARKVFQKSFQVFILKQDFVKTKQLIRAMAEAGIEATVVPEYNLSHCIDKANKMFIGAVSITRDMKVVSAIGMATIVGLCHLNQVPVYLFANTLKISHRDSRDHRIHTKRETKSHDNCSYVLTTHSHDLLDLNLVDHLITEDGEVGREEVRSYLENRLKQLEENGHTPRKVA